MGNPTSLSCEQLCRQKPQDQARGRHSDTLIIPWLMGSLEQSLNHSKSSFVLWVVVTQARVMQKQYLVKLWVPWQWSRQTPPSELAVTAFIIVGLGEGLITHTSKPSSQEPEVTELNFTTKGKTAQLVKCLQNPHKKPGVLRPCDPSPRKTEKDTYGH